MGSGGGDLDNVEDVAEFVEALRRVRVEAGNPSYRLLANLVGPLLRPPRQVRHSTVGDVFQPQRRRLDLNLVVAILQAMGLEESVVAQWRAACVRVHSEPRAGGSEQRGEVCQLPSTTPYFSGRTAELDQLLGVVQDAAATGLPGAALICAIDGMGGIGKTALAVHAAHRLADRFPDGQLFVDLHGYTSGLPQQDPSDALAAILQAYGVAPSQIPADLNARALLYRNRLSGTKTLIILDNAATEAQVRPLLPGSGSCLVLITSRRRLKGLDDAHVLPLDVLALPEAISLLLQAAGPGRIPADDPQAEQIVEVCGRLPLALRIAAALLRHRRSWTPEHLVSTLRNGRLGLKGFTDGDRRLAGVFDLSYQMLAVGHRLAFRRLALIPGPYTDRYALAALLGADPVLAESLLQDLVDHSLLTEPSPGCYRMHDLIREHAGTLSEADPDQQRDLALGRLLHYYAHTAQQASQSIARYPRPVPEGQAPTYAPELSSPDTARSWLRAEWPNLDAAHATAHNRALHEPVIALAAGLAEMLQVYGPWSRALNIHQTAATTAERHGRPTAHATALTDLGRVRHLTGDYSGADEAFTRALEIYRAQGDRLGEANVLTGLGCIGYLTGDYSGAGDTVTAALEIFRTLGHRHGEATALTDLGNIRRMTGDYHEADNAFTRALEIFRALGHRHGEGIVLVDLGNMQQTTGDHSGSIDALTRALEIFRALGHRHGEATALTDLGRVRHLTGDHAGADEAHTQALEIYHALGIRLGEANALTGLGSVRQATGDYRGAVDALARALEIYRALGHRGNEACALNDYAATHAALGQRPRALALYQQALAMNRELNKPDDEAISLEGIAEHHLATGEPTQGTAYLHQALELYRRLGMKPDTERIRARLDGLTSPPPDQHVPADPVVGVST